MEKKDKLLWVKTILFVSIAIFLAMLSIFLVAVSPKFVAGVDNNNWTNYRDTSLSTSSSTINIYTEGQLAQVAYLVNNGTTFNGKEIKICRTLDLSAHIWVPIGNASFQLQANFNGDNHTISGMRISAENTDVKYLGLIGNSNKYIKDLNLADISINAYLPGRIAGICARNVGGTISGCQVSGKITINGGDTDYGFGAYTDAVERQAYVGAICGEMSAGTISLCNNITQITLNGSFGAIVNAPYVSGICGLASKSGSTLTKIEKCLNQGSLMAAGTIRRGNNINLSGICASNDNGVNVSYCEVSNRVEISSKLGYVYGISYGAYSINGCVNKAKDMGGYVAYGIGYVSSKITNCYNSAPITVAGRAYGIGEASEISNCYNSGKIDIGGSCAGIGLASTISYCWNSGTIKTSDKYASGILANTDKDVTIRCCRNSGSISVAKAADYPYESGVGGFIAYTKRGTKIIENCTNTGSISGVIGVGGIVGNISADINYNGSSNRIQNCLNAGTIKGDSAAGGIVGYFLAQKGSLSLIGDYNTGNVTTTGSYAGGIVATTLWKGTDPYDGEYGEITGGTIDINLCYNLGDITSYSNVGGIVGYMNANTQSATYCFNVGNIKAQTTSGGGTNSSNNFVGGIIGRGVSNKPVVNNNANCGNLYCGSTAVAGKKIAGTSGNGGTDKDGNIKNNVTTHTVAAIYNKFGGMTGIFKVYTTGGVNYIYYDYNDGFNTDWFTVTTSYKTISNLDGVSGSGKYYYKRFLLKTTVNDSEIESGGYIKALDSGNDDFAYFYGATSDDYIYGKRVLEKFYWEYSTKKPD